MEATIERFNEEESCSALDRLAMTLSSELIRVETDDLGGAFELALQQVGETLDVDYAAFIQLPDGDDGRQTAFQWVRPGHATDPAADVTSLKALMRALGPDASPVAFTSIPEDLPVGGPYSALTEPLRGASLKSAAIAPITLPGPFSCSLAVAIAEQPRTWSPRVVESLRHLTEILVAAWHRRHQDLMLRQERAEIARLTAHLDTDTQTGGPPFAGALRIDEIVGDSAALRSSVSRLQEVASSDSTVLLLGETGTGKELFAKVIHSRSPRRQFPLVSVNSAALPPTLIESELFGHERGAFTGAVVQRQGRFEVAHRGTLFLDEIGDLPLEVQAKLLRVLQEGEFERLGASRTRKVDVRIIAATHRDLREAVADGRFREDLYYRLNVFPIRVPPLRERLEDVPALVWFLIHKRQGAMHRSIKRVPPEVMDLLQHHSWPGNIRELENVIERALIHSTGNTLILHDDDLEAATHAAGETTLSSVERAHIEEVLRACGWRINGSGNAAERLGLHPNTLRFRMKKLGIIRRRLPQPDRPASEAS
jgi:transcriptional regulator with GAF, ATPase, and Fis domain